MSHAMNAEACKTLERLGYEWKSLDGRHWDWYAQAVKDCLTTECDCPADRMPFGRCCKASPPVADDVVRDAERWRLARERGAYWAGPYAAWLVRLPYAGTFQQAVDSLLAAQQQKVKP